MPELTYDHVGANWKALNGHKEEIQKIQQMFEKPKEEEVTPQKDEEPKSEQDDGQYEQEEESGEDMEALDITCDQPPN